MGWARLDDGFHDHPKVDSLSLAAVGLFTLTLTWAHRHRKTAPAPGFVPTGRAAKLAGKQAGALAAELTTPMPGKDHGLWEPVDGGWLIHDFEDYLPKERDPDERKQAGRKGAARRWELAKQDDGNLPDASMGNGMASDSSRASAPAFPTRPVSTSVNGDLEGGRNETLRASPATTPPKPYCEKHPDGTDDPCGACRRARETRTEWDTTNAKAERAARRHGELESRALAIGACRLCDSAGYRVRVDGGKGGVCNHQPLNRGGLARAQAALKEDS